MHIGFDGKRAFQNKTGLGNYIRSLLPMLTQHFPNNQYTLFAPKETSLFDYQKLHNVAVITPAGFFYKKFRSLWRRKGMVKNIKDAGIDVFHGVSNELPKGIKRTGAKAVVTVHDLIFERFPKTYNFDERYVHRWKIKYACRVADAVIAISQQTKNDLVNFYKIPADKIFICYQSCNQIFQRVVSAEEKNTVKKRYALPDQYFLFVSSIAPRKNLMAICEAMVLLKDKMEIPLVVIGNGKKEKAAAIEVMAANGISNRLIILNELPQSRELHFTTAEDFPAIYQQALALIYPSIFEGFGAPLLEALWSSLPVISSNASCLPEVAGDAALYFSPHDHGVLADHMLAVATDKNVRENLIQKGKQQVQKFTVEKYAVAVMDVYQHVMK